MNGIGKYLRFYSKRKRCCGLNPMPSTLNLKSLETRAEQPPRRLVSCRHIILVLPRRTGTDVSFQKKRGLYRGYIGVI